MGDPEHFSLSHKNNSKIRKQHYSEIVANFGIALVRKIGFDVYAGIVFFVGLFSEYCAFKHAAGNV